MDSLTFISKIIEALAWPVVALILGLVFRQKLLALIPNIKKFKAGPVEAEFELAAKQVLANATEVKSQADATASALVVDGKGGTASAVVSMLREARGDPAGAILAGWARLDGELFRLGLQLQLGFGPTEKTAKVYSTVMSSGMLPSQTASLVQDLRDLHNKVAHAKVVPTAGAAQDYLLAVDRAIELILNWRKNLPNFGPENRS